MEIHISVLKSCKLRGLCEFHAKSVYPEGITRGKGSPIGQGGLGDKLVSYDWVVNHATLPVW